MTLKFALLADVQRPATDSLAPLKKAVKDTNQREPDFVLFCGDLVDHPDSAAEYANVLPVMQELNAPIHYAIGNHDADPQQSDYASLFKRNTGLGQTYYSFQAQGYNFIVLDTTNITAGEVTHYGMVSPAQLVWLQEELAKIKAGEPLIIFSHNPLIPGDRFGVNNAGEVFHLAKDHKLLACFAAHTHCNREELVGEVPVVVSGPLSFGLNGQDTLGYRWVELDGYNLHHLWIPVAASPKN